MDIRNATERCLIQGFNSVDYKSDSVNSAIHRRICKINKHRNELFRMMNHS